MNQYAKEKVKIILIKVLRKLMQELGFPKEINIYFIDLPIGKRMVIKLKFCISFLFVR